jgi:hypothetical protein
MVLPRPTARIAQAAKLEFSSRDRSEKREAGQYGIPLQSTTGRGTVRCTLKAPPLVQGCYSLDIYFDDHLELVDMLEDVLEFGVIPGNVYGSAQDPRTDVGSVYLHGAWHHGRKPPRHSAGNRILNADR